MKRQKHNALEIKCATIVTLSTLNLQVQKRANLKNTNGALIYNRI